MISVYYAFDKEQKGARCLASILKNKILVGQSEKWSLGEGSGGGWG